MLLGVKLDWRGMVTCAGPEFGHSIRESLVNHKGAQETLEPGIQLDSCALQKWLIQLLTFYK